MSDFFNIVIGGLIVVGAIAFELKFGDKLRANRIYRECTRRRRR